MPDVTPIPKPPRKKAQFGKRGSVKGAKGKADRLFSQLVRARGACERCGETDYTKLQCAHIVSRRYSATRCDPINSWVLCAKCHMHLTVEPYEHVAFAIATRGEDGYRRLRERAISGAKVDWEGVVRNLTAQLKELEQ